MASNVPEFIKECVAESGVRLGLALDYLEWPSNGVEAAPSELNALIGLQCAVTRRELGFHFYSEGTMANRKGRIDLMGCNGEVSLAIEAKRLDNLAANARLASLDLDHLIGFRPSYCPPPPGHELNDWWEASPQRWGLLLMTTFLGDVVHDAWEAPDADAARSRLEGQRWKSYEPFLELQRRAELQRFSAPIPLNGRLQTGTATGWILCGAVELGTAPP